MQTFTEVNMKQGSHLHLPAKMERFWECLTNQMNLQLFLRECLTQKSQEIAMNIVLRGFYWDNEGILCVEVNNRIIYEPARLNFDLKEVDIRIAPYVGSAVTIQVVVSSNDTDVFTLRLFHMLRFFSFGMEDL